MKYVSIDASTTCSGWSVFENGKYIDSGFIDLRKDRDQEHRVYEMASKIGQIIDSNKPDVVFIEDTMMNSNTATLKLLASLGGAIKFFCYSHNYKFESIMPSTWRSILGIQIKGAKRQELKNKALSLINDQLGLMLEEDQCEATCLGLAMSIENGFAALKDKSDDDIW